MTDARDAERNHGDNKKTYTNRRKKCRRYR